MNNKTIGVALIVIGVVLLIGSLAGDMIGIGNFAGFGRYQIVGIILGVVVAGAGFVMRARSS